jgi:predicted lipoprotein with Yx(FWY)xxD motif
MAGVRALRGGGRAYNWGMKTLTLVLSVLAALAIAATAMASGGSSAPVTVISTKQFGKVLATKGHLALYTWNKEKDKKVHCTGACATTWPPITLPKGTKLAAHLAHAMGTFGTIVRPDGSTQLTYNGRPVYTFHGDTPTKILCNGVDGWFVVKA